MSRIIAAVLVVMTAVCLLQLGLAGIGLHKRVDAIEYAERLR